MPWSIAILNDQTVLSVGNKQMLHCGNQTWQLMSWDDAKAA